MPGAPLTFPRPGKAGGLLALGMSERRMFAEQVDAAERYQRVQIIRRQRCVIHPVPCPKMDSLAWCFCQQGGHRSGAVWRAKSGSIPLCFQLSFLLHRGAFDGESGLWSSAQARDCLQPSQSTVCTRRLDGDGQPP